MFSFSDESNISIFFCFYIIIFIVTVNFWRILKAKGKTEELKSFPCVPSLIWLHFFGLLLPVANMILVGFLSLIFKTLTSYSIVYFPTVLSLLYHDSMSDWMVPLIFIYSITLPKELPEMIKFRYVKIPRDTVIWIIMLVYGCMFNSFNPWGNNSFNFVDVFFVALSLFFICLHGYRMSFSIAFRDNRFHITLLFVMIKLVFLLTSACFLPAIPNHNITLESVYTPSTQPNSQPAFVFSLDNLKLYESVIQSAVPIHYLAWKHLFFKHI
ncbi:hypothetical protein CAEBREN_05959 [Caenorhabditis brenneri]|uniref:Uncharacterized protein n=1 Tax=Caenorhabditis brenneri TaxID=135651 RepID=G0N920_CAEBE|nr:hypothetical protein CAEBREN_05959 [Caenorhabditis brenneri]